MPKVTTVTQESIDQFLSTLYAKGRAGNTLKAYGTDLKIFLLESGATIPVESFELATMLWLTKNREEMSPKTTRRRLTSIRAFARWAQIDASELAEYSAPTAARTLPHPLPEGIDGVRRLVDVCHHDHHRAYVALCGLSGLRTSEALSITIANFNFADRILLVRGKGDKERYVPISDEVFDIVAVPVLKSDGPVVGLTDRAGRRLITSLGERAGLERRIASHDLRATFATAVMNKTNNIRVVQMLLGHSNVNTTQIYVEAAMEQLREAVAL